MDDDETLSFFFVGNSGNRKALFGNTRELMQLFFNFYVRHHLAADLAEPAQTVCDCEKPILVQRRNISRDIPAVAQNFRGLFGPAEVSLHHVRATDQEQPLLPQRERPHGRGIHDANTHARKRVADLSPLRPYLPESGRPVIQRVHRDGGRALRASVGLERLDSELAFESLDDAVLQLLCPDENILQAAEILRGATPDVRLQEGWRGEQERN